MIDKTAVAGASLSLMRLFAGDYRRSIHMREAARLSGLDASTARLHLLKLEGLNVLRSSTAGRNVAFAPNLRNLVARHYIAMSEVHEAVRFMKDLYLAKQVLVDLDPYADGALVLFGSYASGTHDERSDMDLLVMGPRIDYARIRRTEQLTNVELDVKYAEPRQFTRSLRDGEALAREVVSNHVVLSGADTFCRAVWRYYVGR